MSFLKTLFDKTPTVAEVDHVVVNLRERQQEIEARLARINPNEMVSGRTLYHETLRDGTPEDVSKLDRENELLNIESRQINHRLVELQTVRAKAEAAEAAKALPGHIRALPGLIDEYDKALAALRQVKAKVDNEVGAVSAGRSAMEGSGQDIPAVPEKIIERISEIRGFIEPEDPARYNTARQLLYRDLAGGKSPRYRGDDDPKKGKYKKGHDHFGKLDPQKHPEVAVWGDVENLD